MTEHQHNTSEAECMHCLRPIVAFLPSKRLWYLNEQDKDYLPWNYQVRTVPCRVSPTGRHVPRESMTEVIEEALEDPRVKAATEWQLTHPPGARLPEHLEP